MIEASLLNNCTVIKVDILVTEYLFGPDLGSLKEKNTRSKTKHTPAVNNTTPHGIIKVHGNTILCSDIMFVNRVVFMTIISIHIKFRTAQHLKNTTILSL